MEINRCQCCGISNEIEDLRFGICFDCMDAECVIGRGETAYDKQIQKLTGYSEAMSRLHYVLNNHLRCAWQDIETAPKDRHIIIYDKGVYTGCWGEANGEPNWVISGTCIPMCCPTHWMPLQSPPEEND